MRKCYINQAKLIVNVSSDKSTKRIKTVTVYDNRTNEYWNEEQINERGVQEFLNTDDMKETLNWNLNGDSSKYQFQWGQSNKLYTDGYAYIVA
jgi:hypothetical protein